MKIKNMNKWLPKPYFTVIANGNHIGNYSTQESANEAYRIATNNFTIKQG